MGMKARNFAQPNPPTRYEARFWELIEASRSDWDPQARDGNQEAQVKRLESLLSALPAAEVLEFAREEVRNSWQAYRCDLWDVATMATGWASDDGFIDFRSWLISMGRAVYQAALEDPDWLVEVLDAPGVEYPGFEDFGYVAQRVYERQTGAEMPELDLVAPKRPAGAFATSKEARKRRYPRVYARYQASEDNQTPTLTSAAADGKQELVAELLAAGADPNQIFADDRYALADAAAEGHLHIVEQLLAAGAEVNGPTHPEATPLAAAAECGQAAVALYLLERGADPDPEDWRGTPLVLAAATGCAKLVRALVSRGANVNYAIPDNGTTALIFAAAEGDKEAVAVLLECGADAMLIDSDGASAWGCAEENGYPEVAALFPVEARKPNPPVDVDAKLDRS